MKIKSLLLAATLATSAHAADSANAPIVLDSQFDFAKTVDTLENTLKDKGMTIFARIDHQAAAKEAGLDMQPAIVIVYGTPKAGTPLMVKDPSLALQLPLKVLVTEVDGKVQVILNSAEQVVARSSTSYADVENTLAKAENLVRATVVAK
ncbi:MAG: DUF302 domain-containing protein [Cardiobacteriaceae bacterium]|nr:DUF302 domain-containing protein [Cardiobacteriaceae bacterium]